MTAEALQTGAEVPTDISMEPPAAVARRSLPWKIWLYVAVVATASAVLAFGPVRSVDIPRIIITGAPIIVVLGVYLAEVAVIHIQVRRDTHSFSMSEVPVIVGAFLLDPLVMMGVVGVGNLLALSITRRQSPVKLVTNVALSVIQGATIVLVIGAIGVEASLGVRTILAAFAGALLANLVAHGLIVVAIRASGGAEPFLESIRTLAITSLGACMNALLAIFAVSMIETDRGAGWLGVAPPVFLYLAYRGYTSQRADKERVTKLFEATQALHRTPQVERALEKAGEIALDLVQASRVHILVFGQEAHDIHYLTTVSREGESGVMVPVILDLGRPPFSGVFGHLEPIRFHAPIANLPLVGWVQDALAAPLNGDGERIGVILATDRVGDVSSFDERDLQMLSTLGSQLAVSLMNGRLIETLAEVRSLQARLEELVKSKDQLIASVSHELRTPLTGIIGLAQIMKELTSGSLDQEPQELLDMIVDQGNDLSNIIDDLLAYARTENGSLTVDIQSFEVSTVIQGVITGSEGRAIEAPAATGVSVLADPMRVKQVLRNLITNARRYGGERIWLEVEDANGEVAILVCDNGTGIRPDRVESVFEPYQSAHDQRLQPGSVGLGLALSRKLARLMDGDLRYERHTGTTVFRLTLNRAEAKLRSLSFD
jgi:signal transduction histidine kinase